MSEQKIHESICQFLNVALPTGAYHVAVDSAGKATYAIAARLKARGGKRGTPDHHCLVAGFPAIYFEVKTKIGRLSPDQVKTADAIRANGGLWFVVRCVEDVDEALTHIGMPLRATLLDLRAANAANAAPVRKAPRKTKAEPRFVMGKRVLARARKQGIML